MKARNQSKATLTGTPASKIHCQDITGTVLPLKISRLFGTEKEANQLKALQTTQKDLAGIESAIAQINNDILKTEATATSLTGTNKENINTETSLIKKLEAEKKKVQEQWAEDSEANIAKKKQGNRTYRHRNKNV
mgnify:CR=1 FL=1